MEEPFSEQKKQNQGFIRESKVKCIGKNKDGSKCKKWALCGEYCRIHFELKLKEGGTNVETKDTRIISS